MHTKFRNLLLIPLAALAFAGCGDDDDDNNDNQVNNPTATATPAPTATPSSLPFRWASVRLDHREDVVLPPPPGSSCNGFTRFEVRSNGAYRFRDPCDVGPDKTGNITANELGVLDAQMNGISREEANAKLKCVDFGDNLTRADQRLSMASAANRYVLYTQDDDKQCVSGNPAEVTVIRDSLYALRSKYSTSTP